MIEIKGLYIKYHCTYVTILYGIGLYQIIIDKIVMFFVVDNKKIRIAILTISRWHFRSAKLLRSIKIQLTTFFAKCV